MAIPDAHGVKYLDVVTLCWLAYKGNFRFGRWQSVTGNIWDATQKFEKGSFHAALFKGQKTILAFSGTDEARDWIDNISQGLTGIAGQYLYALRLAGSVGCEMVVGHSLGGGLASFVAIHKGIKGATVNPAALNTFIGRLPNLPNIIQMIRRGNLVINYVVPGEALDILDIAAFNMKRVGKIIHVPSKAGFFSVIRKHGLDDLLDPVSGNTFKELKPQYISK